MIRHLRFAEPTQLSAWHTPGPLDEAEHQERIALAWALHRRTNQPQAWTKTPESF